jgi:hypothetical protein
VLFQLLYHNVRVFTWAWNITLTLLSATLMLRLFALYQLDRIVLCIMMIVFMGCLGSAATIMALNLIKVDGECYTSLAMCQSHPAPSDIANAHAIPGMPACVPLYLSDRFWLYWIPILISEGMMCTFALNRAFSGAFAEPSVDEQNNSHGRASKSTPIQRFVAVFRNGQRIVDVLIRDSILFFLVYAFVICHPTYMTINQCADDALLTECSWLTLPTHSCGGTPRRTCSSYPLDLQTAFLAYCPVACC